jgi:uncharacterized protein (TIGR03084 family)
VDITEIVADLNDESESLDAIVAGLAETDWQRETPATGWTVTHQIAHLAASDKATLLGITDPAAFAAHLQDAIATPDTFVDTMAEQMLAPPAQLLPTWRSGRAALAHALTHVPAGQKIPWYGVSMSPTSMTTARIMETWAHGLDIAQTLAVLRVPTARLRHVVHLGYRTLPWAFMVHGEAPPQEPVRLELTAPDGSLWTYGPDGAANTITGPALDFCLLVTQRAHRSTLGLVAVGPVADAFLNVAQAFAGPPGAGRGPQ